MPMFTWPPGGDDSGLLVMPAVGAMTFSIEITGPSRWPIVGDITVGVRIFGPLGSYPHQPLVTIPMTTEVGIRIYGPWRNAIQPPPPEIPPPEFPGGPDGPIQAPAPPPGPDMTVVGGGAGQKGTTFTAAIGEAGTGSVTSRGGGAGGHRDDLIFFVGGAAKFGGFVTNIVDQTKGPNDGADVATALQCAGWLDEWQYMKVLPDIGGEHPDRMGAPSGPDRHFNFASSTGIDHTSWPDAAVIAGNYGGDPRGPVAQRPNFTQPKSWPWLQSRWIGPAHPTGVPGEVFYPSRVFSVPKGYYAIHVACKDEYELWLDGVLLGGRTGFYGGQKEIYDVEIGSQFHLMVAKCTTRGGRGGFNMAMMPYTSNGTPAHAAMQTDGSWNCLSTPTPPTMTVGQIIRQLLAEGQARGRMPGWTCGFSDHTDSNGVAWPRLSDYSLSIGMDGLAVLQQMGNAWFDYWCAPSVRRLMAAQSGGIGGDHTESPLISASVASDSSQTYDCVLVQYDGPGGQVMVGSGHREGVIHPDGVTTEAGAIAVGQAWLRVNGRVRTTDQIQGLPRGEGNPETSYDYDLGTMLNGHRVAGVTATLEDDGKVTVAPQLTDSLTIAEEALNRKLLSLGTGGPGQPSGPGKGVPWLNDPRPADDGELKTVSIHGQLSSVPDPSPSFAAGRPCVITRVSWTLRTPGTTQSAIQFLADDVVKILILLAPGKHGNSVDVPNIVVVPTDNLAWQVIQPGNGAEGLLIQTFVAYA